jgi:hypothetical protein
MAFVSSALLSDLRAEEAAAVEHVPELYTTVYHVADLVLPLASSAHSVEHPNFEWLVDLIELRTGADCWSHSGGHGSITAENSKLSLIIRQTQATHERICDLLDEIRRTGDLALSVEIQLVRGDLDAFGDGKPHRSAQGLVDAHGKERLLKFLHCQSDGEIVAAPKITFFNGSTASIATVDQGREESFQMRGVVSKDNRYSRLWLEANVDGQTTKAELLVPEGHTAVRKLPGHNSWLLVTSRVINAEEPQVVAPATAPTTSPAEKKRYLVPVDDSSEPTDLTGIPEFKAQAEGFGLSIQRAKVSFEAAAEKSAELAEAQPKLASGLEHVEYQVAQAEPRHLTNLPIPTPTTEAIGFIDELLYVPGAGPLLNASVFETREKCGEEKPGNAVVNSFEVNPQPDEPPARLDVCLDEPECQPAPRNQPQPGQLFNRIFVTPLPTFPMPFNGMGRPAEHGSITIDHWKDQPRVTVSHLEFGRRAILTKPKPKPFPEASNGVVLLPDAGLRRVEPASGTHSPVASIESQLTTAAAGLEELGLTSEAKVLHALIHSIRIRAEERCQQIDVEIARLKAARKKLEDLAHPPTTGGAEGSVETR